MDEIAKDPDAEFVKELKEVMLKHKPKGTWQTWMSGDGRVIIMKRKPDGSADT
jgi:hypothetical protein